jgi:CheY-like chemotaxis protein
VDHLFTILIAEDQEDDAFLLRQALAKAEIANPVQIVVDGEQAIAYLEGKGSYADRAKFPFPGLIFLDLKMPRKNGFEVLAWLREQPKCSIIPTVVFTSSRHENDVRVAYRLGANCYIVKPTDFNGLLGMLTRLFQFWSICELPHVESC